MLSLLLTTLALASSPSNLETHGLGKLWTATLEDDLKACEPADCHAKRFPDGDVYVTRHRNGRKVTSAYNEGVAFMVALSVPFKECAIPITLARTGYGPEDSFEWPTLKWQHLGSRYGYTLTVTIKSDECIAMVLRSELDKELLP